MIAHGPAASIWRKISPCDDHKSPAATTSATPVPYRIPAVPVCPATLLINHARRFAIPDVRGRSRVIPQSGFTALFHLATG
jgi:hypothetical protein